MTSKLSRKSWCALLCFISETKTSQDFSCNLDSIYALKKAKKVCCTLHHKPNQNTTDFSWDLSSQLSLYALYHNSHGSTGTEFPASLLKMNMPKNFIQSNLTQASGCFPFREHLNTHLNTLCLLAWTHALIFLLDIFSVFHKVTYFEKVYFNFILLLELLFFSVQLYPNGRYSGNLSQEQLLHHYRNADKLTAQQMIHKKIPHCLILGTG